MSLGANHREDLMPGASGTWTPMSFALRKLINRKGKNTEWLHCPPPFVSRVVRIRVWALAALTS